MIYSGYKHALENANAFKYMPMEWEKQLDWQDGPQVIPSPFKEITYEQWFIKSVCGHEAQRESFSVGMNIPCEAEWFGGWHGHLTTYHTYGLITVSMNYSPWSPLHVNKPMVGLGINIQKDQYTSYVVRFFEIGCQHEWRAEPSRKMFEHISICLKCGQEVRVDSSG